MSATASSALATTLRTQSSWCSKGRVAVPVRSLQAGEHAAGYVMDGCFDEHARVSTFLRTTGVQPEGRRAMMNRPDRASQRHGLVETWRADNSDGRRDSVRKAYGRSLPDSL